jgi:putative N-acetylmannosamine-6-phosphate epimerase
MIPADGVLEPTPRPNPARALTRTVLNRVDAVSVVSNSDIIHIGAPPMERSMDELNGKLIACQILITGLIARVANEQRDPLRFLTDFRDEIKAVVNGVNIVGMDSTDRVRAVAQKTVDELFSLMKPPSSD